MKRALMGIAVAASVGAVTFYAFAEEAKKWTVHDESRPKPVVVTPGKYASAETEQVLTAPSDALVLFDGKDLSKWEATGGGEPTWKLVGGAMEAAGKDMQTKDAFGDCQLHVEWATPNPPSGTGQGRGNSGVYIMGNYEVQVLDSYQADTYADGQAGALYGQYPPLVNASLPPGQWQVYDIVFHGARFADDGKVLKPTTLTVFHNGVLVQDHSELKGTTAHHSPGVYTKHPEKLPLRLQFHGNPTKFRNIWIRPLQ